MEPLPIIITAVYHPHADFTISQMDAMELTSATVTCGVAGLGISQIWLPILTPLRAV